MVDPIFADPRLAVIYDEMDPDRGDLDAYLAIVEELGAESVLDIGCGTGTFACLLAARGLRVVGVDPAAASLEVARSKPNSEKVRWHLGDCTTLPSLRVDVATMTGNVAQVFVEDAEWSATLRAVHHRLAPGGHLVFETRIPERRGWEEWNKAESFVRVDTSAAGPVEAWVDLTEVTDRTVSFRWTYRFEHAAETVVSDSTLRFRSLDELAESLTASGYDMGEVRDAADRPGKEFVVIAQRSP